MDPNEIIDLVLAPLTKVAGAPEPLLEQAYRDVQQLMERGYFEEYDRDDFVESHHFSELSLDDKFHLLSKSIDWNGYIGRGIQPDTPARIMANAVVGQPRERWLEPTQDIERGRGQ